MEKDTGNLKMDFKILEYKIGGKRWHNGFTNKTADILIKWNNIKGDISIIKQRSGYFGFTEGCVKLMKLFWRGDKNRKIKKSLGDTI